MTCGSDFRLKKLYLFLHIFVIFSRENSRLGTSPPMMKSVWSHLNTKHTKNVTVVGDSMVKNLQGWRRLSTEENHVVAKSFAGATTSDMEDYVKPVIRKEPQKLILHVGTNDLKKLPPNRDQWHDAREHQKTEDEDEQWYDTHPEEQLTPILTKHGIKKKVKNTS